MRARTLHRFVGLLMLLGDTDRIDAIYKVHYLQWTGIDMLDRIVGGVGLVLILVPSGLGVRLWLRAR